MKLPAASLAMAKGLPSVRERGLCGGQGRPRDRYTDCLLELAVIVGTVLLFHGVTDCVWEEEAGGILCTNWLCIAVTALCKVFEYV